MNKVPLIIAHRGASYDAPENTLAAVNLAWQQGTDAVEVDVHLSRDGVPVIMHDVTTGRTTGVDYPVGSLTFHELRRLDAGSWKGPQWKGETVPALTEILQTLPPDKSMFVEVKNNQTLMAMLPHLPEMKKIAPEQIALMDFNYGSVVWAKKNLPQYSVLWLIELNRESGPFNYQSIIEKCIKKTVDAGLDGLNLEIDVSLDEQIIKHIYEAGLKLYVWTVDDPSTAKWLISKGISGLTTNRPGWLKQQLKL